MLECRFTAASRFLMAVSLGSQGVLVSYIPHCTVHGSVAAWAARGETQWAATTSKSEASRIAPSRLDRIGWCRTISATGYQASSPLIGFLIPAPDFSFVQSPQRNHVTVP